MPDKKTLDYYVAELRRVEKSRQADTEKEVEKIYKDILKELNHFLADEYADHSDSDGKLSVGVLNLRGRYAKFLQEVDKHLNTVTPDISAEIKKTVEATYKSVYKGMVKAVEDSTDNAELHERFKDLNLRPEVVKNAVENPISGLTLPDTLEKHRQEVIYGIKQQIGIGLMTGERYDTMAKNIKRSVFGVDGKSGLYGKSMRIVRTEVHRVQESGLADSAKDIMQGLEGSGLVEVAIWRTMKDERVRPQLRVRNARGKWITLKRKTTADHQKMEGKAIIVGDKFELESGVFAECPGKSGTARNDINCRCFLEYKLVDIEEAARLTGKSVEEINKKIEKNMKGSNITDGASGEITYVSDDKAEITELNKMSNGGGVDWSETKPVKHSKEVQRELVEYGKSKNVNVYAISKFDGDADILKEQIDVINETAKEYGIDKIITVTFDILDDDDFASTVNNTITFNTKVLRDREITNEILNADDFLSSSDIRGIAAHEMGHIILRKYGNKGVEIAKKAYYNIYGGEVNTAEIINYLSLNISTYAISTQSNKRNLKIKDSDYKELLSEVISKNKTNFNDFTIEFVRLLKELIK